MFRTVLAGIATAVLIGSTIAAPVPKPPPSNFYLTCYDGIHVLPTEGKSKDPYPPVRADNFWVKNASVSPDGVWIAYLATMVRPGHEGPDRAVFIRKITDKDGEKRLTWRKFAHILGWVGNTLYYRGGDEYDTKNPDPLGIFVTSSMKVFTYDTKTEKTAEFDLPEDHLPEYLLPDGKAVITEKWTVDGKKATGKLCRVTLANGKVKELLDLGASTFGGYGRPGTVSPDGGKLIGLWSVSEKTEVRGEGKMYPFGDAHLMRDGREDVYPVFIDTTTGKQTELKLKHEPGPLPTRWAWSPDGSKAAMVRSKTHHRQNDDPPNKPETWDYVITVFAADGTGAKEIATVEGGLLFGFDWR